MDHTPPPLTSFVEKHLMGFGYWILDKNGNPVELTDHVPGVMDDALKTWADWMETADRHVALDFVRDIKISTVFLGMDHSFFQSGPPLLYETMIFGGRYDMYQDRYSCRYQALRGHAKAVRLVRLFDKGGSK